MASGSWPCPDIAGTVAFFDEAWYRTRHPDISPDMPALHHYLDIGRQAGAAPGPRPPERPQGGVIRPVPARPGIGRMERLRAYAPERAKILEIGAAYNPIAPRRAGYRSHVLDNVDRSGLLERYAGHPNVDFDAIEEVDFVVPDGDLLNHIPREHWSSFDVIYLSHVLEHVPDPIGFLRALQKLVGIGGKVVLAMPDKRACFDFFRPMATTGMWLEAFAEGRSRFRRDSLFDFYTLSIVNRQRISWNWGAVRAHEVELIGMTIEQAYNRLYGAGSGSGEAPDCHVWAFTPSIMSLLLHDCYALGLVSLAPVHITRCVDFEFFVELRLAHRAPIDQAGRLSLLADAAAEQRDGFALLRG